jgi:hypothetical protein
MSIDLLITGIHRLDADLNVTVRMQLNSDKSSVGRNRHLFKKKKNKQKNLINMTLTIMHKQECEADRIGKIF